MIRTIILMLSCIICFCIACNREEIIESPPCLHTPCADSTNYYGNKVARNADFRIGKWVNIRDSAPVKDTLTFHSDTTFSHSYNGEGLIMGKYDFWFVYFRLYTNYANEEIENPIKKETMYNDTTGVLSVLHNTNVIGGHYQLWDHFVKVE